MTNAINVNDFCSDGRGPVLRRVCWGFDGTVLRAIEYLNADDFGDESLRHVRFAGMQVVQITPEEVIDYTELGPRLARSRPAAMFELGRSPWLESFSQRHLSQCRHFQLMFYDELIDVICEGVTCHTGPFREEVAG
jgi:hypothetical protein